MGATPDSPLLEMVPRVIVSAGFEPATGMYLDVMDPREAARQLRCLQEREGPGARAFFSLRPGRQAAQQACESRWNR